jgi:membrane fusion protein (multidrug efflux system)
MSTLAETVPSLPPPADAAVASPLRSLSRRTLGLIALAIAVLAGGGAYGWSLRGLESTDNAQVDAEVIAVPARVSGTIASLRFQENQRVHAGDVLAVLDDAPAQAKLAQAQASLEAAHAAAEAAEADARVATTNARGNRAIALAALRTSNAGASTASVQVHEARAALSAAKTQLAQAQEDKTRADGLFADGALARSAYDQAQTVYSLAVANVDTAQAKLATLESSVGQAQGKVLEASARADQANDVDSLVAQAVARAKSAQAQVQTAQAARDLAALELSYTRIVAPSDGVVSKKTIALGQQVSLGQPIVQLVTPERWVTANFKETQLAHMLPGQRVELSVDAFPNDKLVGQVESFSAATGSRFTLLPPDNASGNFTKVVQRVPVRIRVPDLPEGVALRPGMSVELTVDTNG